jgi:single-strand DNA-binding protein
MSVGVDDHWKDREGVLQDRTEWFRVSAWGRLGESCSTHLKKGREVYIEGKMRTDEWTDKEGVARSRQTIRAEVVKFLGRSGHSGQSDQGE